MRIETAFIDTLEPYLGHFTTALRDALGEEVSVVVVPEVSADDDVRFDDVWQQMLSRIETKVTRHAFYTWFKPTRFLEDVGTTVTVRVPNLLFRDWLTKHYADIIDEALVEVSRPSTAVSFVIAAEFLSARRDASSEED